MSLKVFTARPYRMGALGSCGNARSMLLRQYQFPHTYDPHEKHIMVDHDRLLDQDRGRVNACFRKHTGTGEMGFGDWVRTARDETIMSFLQELLPVDKKILWTGYRVMGTLNPAEGVPVYTLELFAKHPDSKTKTYSDADAPNVESAKK